MRTTTVSLPDGKWPKYVIATGDWHKGNPAVHKGGIRRCIEDCKNHLWVHHGDAAECIMPTDKRFTADEHRETVLDSCTSVAEDIIPANRTCLGMLEGNHEGGISRLIGSTTKLISDTAKIPNLEQTHGLHLTGAKRIVRWFVAHGTLTFLGRAGDVQRRRLNMELRLCDYLGAFDYDLAGLGHGHTGVVAPPVYRRKLNTGCKRVPVMVKPGWAYMTPSFFRVYGEQPSYAEGWLVNPCDLGWVRIYIDRDGTIPAITLVNEDGRVVDTRKPEVLS